MKVILKNENQRVIFDVIEQKFYPLELKPKVMHTRDTMIERLEKPEIVRFPEEEPIEFEVFVDPDIFMKAMELRAEYLSVNGDK